MFHKIHSHPKYKVGKREPSGKPALKFSAIRNGVTITAPIVPLTLSDMAGVVYGLDNNDKYGVCVPTGFDNFIRTITKLFTGTQISATWAQIVAWYKEQNPDFNEETGAGDNGMDIQTFLEARVADGTILAFASVDSDSESQIREAIYIFLAIILGVDLQVAQQTQTDANPPIWDYSRSGEWGGHCVVEPAFLAANDECISWDMVVQMTQKFLGAQRSEAWVVITQLHIDNPTFRKGISLDLLNQELSKLTGKTYDFKPTPVPVPTPVTPPAPAPAPTPTPTPSPVPTNNDVDQALWTIAEDWVEKHRHSGEASEVAKALEAWAVAKGLNL